MSFELLATFHEQLSKSRSGGGSQSSPWWTRFCQGPGRFAAGVLLLLIALFYAAFGERFWGPARNFVFDAYQRSMPRAVTRLPVVIVDIDERSLAAFGRWPWPRTRLAQLVEATHRLGARAVGLDILMPEPDSLSPPHLLADRQDLIPALREALSQLPSNDAVLARTLRQVPSVIARAALFDGEFDAPVVTEQTPLIALGDSSSPFLQSYPAALANVPELEAAAAGRGYINDTRDRDGVVRAMPLLIAVNGAPAPAFAVEVLRVAVGETRYSVQANGRGVLGVKIGDLFIPTDADGSIRVYFSPPHGERRISAAAILKGEAKVEALADRVAIIGVTAAGIADIAATPLAARMDGVEIQAQLIENILEQSRLKRPASARWWELLALVVFALLLIMSLPRLKPLHGVLVFAAGVALFGIASWLLFALRNELYDPTFPAAANGMMVLVLLTGGFTASERRWREILATLGTERVERSRAAGELRVAREIQMGMLPDPHAIEGIPPTVEFFALLEPAQEVGGDLYDAFMLDPHRLFFTIGDVSGKGVPASLFMALTKTISKSLARRERVPLDRLMGLVNEEISRENPAAMFVTAIIGIIDGRSGEVEICNAGHNAPVLLRPEQAPRELDGAGGPPLCVDEEFHYPLQRLRLESGDILLFITDGVTEAEDGRQAQYGSARMFDCFVRSRPNSAAEACARLRADVKAFTAGAAASDDLTIMAVRFSKKA